MSTTETQNDGTARKTISGVAVSAGGRMILRERECEQYDIEEGDVLDVTVVPDPSTTPPLEIPLGFRVVKSGRRVLVPSELRPVFNFDSPVTVKFADTGFSTD